MNTKWHVFKEIAPPEEVILLVNGPLGLDLAVKLEDHLYFKKGDDWAPNNLEHWQYNMPTHWAKPTLPAAESDIAKYPALTNGSQSFSDYPPAPPVMEIADSHTRTYL